MRNTPKMNSCSMLPNMDLTLSWDLFVIVFFGIVMSYSFIIGKHEAVKIIVFTYIAIVAGMAAGNLLEQLSDNSASLLSSFGLSIDISILDSTKLVIFIATIILLAIRGGFDVEYGNDDNNLVNTVLTGVFGFATAGLLLTTLITFIAGAPLLDTQLAQAAILSPVIKQSNLMQIMILYQNLWFVLPALLLIGVGVVSNGGKE